MKYIFTLALVAFSMFFASCSSPSNDGDQASAVDGTTPNKTGSPGEVSRSVEFAETSYRTRYEATTRKLDSLTGFDPAFSERYTKSRAGQDIQHLKVRINRLLVNEKLDEAQAVKVDALLDSLDYRIAELVN